MPLSSKMYAMTAVAVLLIGGLALTFGTGEDDEDSGPIIGRPDSEVLAGIEADIEMLVLSESAYEAAPSAALLWRKAGISTNIGGESELGLTTGTVQTDDPSRISSEIAVSFWDEPRCTIVAENYSHAVRMVPAAVALDAPILIWGDTTAEALGTVMPKEVIVCGDTPLNKHSDRGLVVLDETSYFFWTLETLVAEGADTSYLVVTNPGDDDGRADVPHLSAFASLLAVHRNALILTAGPNGTDINASVHDAYEYMDLAGFDPEYLCMFGDAKALEFMYRHFDNYEEDGMPSENPVPADDWYADRDGDPFTMEVAAGRLIAKSLPDMSRYFERLLYYEQYWATTSRPAEPVPQQTLDWNNNGMVYCALAAEFDTRSLNEVWKDFYFDGQFNSADDSAPAHGTYSGMPNAVNPVVNEFTRANFIAINADHGNPGSTVTFNADDLMPLHPGVTFAVSCNLGRIDDLVARGYSVDESICYTFMEMGLLTYVAPTRVTYGVISTSTFDPEIEQDDNKAGNGLCRLFYEKIINEDLTVGQALMLAHNDLVNSAEWDEEFNDEEQAINLCVAWEYQCYGDPAFNPYEPVNEG